MEISLKKNLMIKMLDQVPNLGWTWNALHEAAKTAKKAKSSSKKELQALFENKISNIRKYLTKFSRIFECGAVQKCANLVDLFKTFQTSLSPCPFFSISFRTR